MRIVFIGTVEFSRKALSLLIQIKAQVVGVVGKHESSFNSDFADLAPLCAENELPFLNTNNINSEESITWIVDKKPDVIYCFGWSSLLKARLLKIAPLGVIGFHPAMLPQNRGRHPLIWALFLGLHETASTFFFMNEDADGGDILSQMVVPIDGADDAGSLYGKIIDTAMVQIEEFTNGLTSGNYIRINQNEANANEWRKRTEEDGRIDFRMCSIAIYNLIRALTHPYVGAHVVNKGLNVKVWKAEIIPCSSRNFEPGKVLDCTQQGIVVKTYDGAIRLIGHAFENMPLVGEYL